MNTIFYLFIFLGILLLLYFILQPKSTESDSNQFINECKTKNCPDGCNQLTGQCLKVDKCNGNPKPDEKCKDNKDYVCVRDQWKCDGDDKCQNSTTPDTISCKTSELQCDSAKGELYCNKAENCNGGKEYYKDNTSYCQCTDDLFGKKCQFDKKTACGGTDAGTITISDDSYKCICNNNKGYYRDKDNDNDNCDKKCDDHKIYSDDKCVCDLDLYHANADTCDENECGYGDKNTSGVCVCKTPPKYIGPKCNIPICDGNSNKQLNDDGTCSCLPDVDGHQYYGSDCKEFKCTKSSEFKCTKDGTDCTPSCECDNDHLCKYCQFTTKDCTDHGDVKCDNDNDTMTCHCNDDYEGDKCQCEKSSTSNTITDIEICKGYYPECQTSGSYTKVLSNCEQLEKGTYSGGKWSSNQEWIDYCYDLVKYGNNTDKSKFKGSLICSDNSITGKIEVKYQGCPDDLIQCMVDGKIDDTKISLCDSTTNYEWACVDKVNDNCTANTTGPLCGGVQTGTTYTPAFSTCQSCDNCGQELICPNLNVGPSLHCLGSTCLKKLIEKKYTGYNGSIYLETSNDTHFPYCPTTSNSSCKLYKEDNNINDNVCNAPVFGSYKINIDNPIGSIGEIDDTTTYYDLNQYDNKDPKMGQTDGSRFFHPNKTPENINDHCPLFDKDILEDIFDIKDTSATLCSGRGTFVQDTVQNDGYTFYKKSGHCNCSDYISKTDNSNKVYLGKNCQYDDNTNCSGHGIVGSDSKCSCSEYYSGDNCESVCNGGTLVTDKYDETGIKQKCQCSDELSDKLQFGESCEFIVDEKTLTKDGKANMENEYIKYYFDSRLSCTSRGIDSNKCFYENNCNYKLD